MNNIEIGDRVRLLHNATLIRPDGKVIRIIAPIGQVVGYDDDLPSGRHLAVEIENVILSVLPQNVEMAEA